MWVWKIAFSKALQVCVTQGAQLRPHSPCPDHSTSHSAPSPNQQSTSTSLTAGGHHRTKTAKLSGGGVGREWWSRQRHLVPVCFLSLKIKIYPRQMRNQEQCRNFKEARAATWLSVWAGYWLARPFFIPLLLFKASLPHDSNRRGNTAALVLKSAFITELRRGVSGNQRWWCLIVKGMHSKREPYCGISEVLRHTNTMQHIPHFHFHPPFPLSCTQVLVSSERCRDKTFLPAKISWISPQAPVAAMMAVLPDLVFKQARLNSVTRVAQHREQARHQCPYPSSWAGFLPVFCKFFCRMGCSLH